MNIFITGGTGYIGREVTRRLLERGDRVTILTRDKDKVRSDVMDKVTCLEGDIADRASIERLDIKSLNVEIVIHLAASLDYFGERSSLFRTNVLGTENILRLSIDNGVNKFICASSIEAMGPVIKDEIPADETCACRPISSYGVSKLEAERLVRKISEEAKLDTVILRLTNVYGPDSRAFIEPIANAILRRDKLFTNLVIYSGHYLHPLYISDAAMAFLRACETIDGRETYIIGGEEYLEIGLLFTLVGSFLPFKLGAYKGKKGILDEIYLRLRTNFRRHRRKADLLSYFMAGEYERVHRAYAIGKAKKELDYSPKVDLKQGVEKTLQWLRDEGLLKL